MIIIFPHFFDKKIQPLRDFDSQVRVQPAFRFDIFFFTQLLLLVFVYEYKHSLCCVEYVVFNIFP